MAFSLPRAHRPCSLTSKGSPLPPQGGWWETAPSKHWGTNRHSPLQGQAHLPGRKKAESCLGSTAGLALGHTSQVRHTDRQTDRRSLPLLPDCQLEMAPLLCAAQNISVPVLLQGTLWEGTEQPRGSLNNLLSVCCLGKKGISSREQCQALLLQEK